MLINMCVIETLQETRYHSRTLSWKILSKISDLNSSDKLLESITMVCQYNVYAL